jgi:hypothetical protein
MLRHAELRASRIVRLGQTTQVALQEASSVRGRKGLKARIEMLRRGKSGLMTGTDKGKAKEEAERVEVDRQGDLRLYLDDRCPRTREWFEKTFCLEKVCPMTLFATPWIKLPVLKKQSRLTKTAVRGSDSSSPLVTGVRVFILQLSTRALWLSDGVLLAGDGSGDIIVFGQLDASYHGGASASHSRLALQLFVGRRKTVKKAFPRPDDPLPRGPRCSLSLSIPLVVRLT